MLTSAARLHNRTCSGRVGAATLDQSLTMSLLYMLFVSCSVWLPGQPPRSSHMSRSPTNNQAGRHDRDGRPACGIMVSSRCVCDARS